MKKNHQNMFATQGKSWFKKMSVGKLKEEGQLK